jgi:hypothetical protein
LLAVLPCLAIDQIFWDEYWDAIGAKVWLSICITLKL